MRDVGKNIRDLRERKQLTQEELAARLFVTRQTVSNYETGKSRPDVEMLCKIADTLEVDANTILYGAPQPQRKQNLRRFGIATGILGIMIGIYFLCKPICRELSIMQFIVSPTVLLQTVWVPLTAVVGGWWLMQAAALLLKAQPICKPWGKYIRRAVLGLLIGCLAILLPYCIFWLIGDVRLLRDGAVDMVFDYIPLLSDAAYGLIWVNRSAAPVYSVLGALLWVTGFPVKKENNSRCA